MAKPKSDEQIVLEKILQKKNKNLSDWRKEVISNVQIAFFRGEDKELEAMVIERETKKLLIQECKKIQ